MSDLQKTQRSTFHFQIQFNSTDLILPSTMADSEEDEATASSSKKKGFRGKRKKTFGRTMNSKGKDTSKEKRRMAEGREFASTISSSSSSASYSKRIRFDSILGGEDDPVSAKERKAEWEERTGCRPPNEEEKRTTVMSLWFYEFDCPDESEWYGKDGIVTVLSKRLQMDRRTVSGVLKTLMKPKAGEDTTQKATKRKSGSGRKFKLDKENEGLIFGALALNMGASPGMATCICNSINRDANGNMSEAEFASKYRICRNAARFLAHMAGLGLVSFTCGCQSQLVFRTAAGKSAVIAQSGDSESSLTNELRGPVERATQPSIASATTDTANESAPSLVDQTDTVEIQPIQQVVAKRLEDAPEDRAYSQGVARHVGGRAARVGDADCGRATRGDGGARRVRDEARLECRTRGEEDGARPAATKD